MVSRTSKDGYRRGFSLVDTMVAVVILLIAVIGTSIFRYNAVLDGRRFNSHTSAARVALVLCESWRGVNGDTTFDPIQLSTSDLKISQSTKSVSAVPSDFKLLGRYAITMNDVHGVEYHTTLSWKDIKTGLRALNVVVSWAQRSPDQDGEVNVDKSYRLTVYAHNF